jgi:hypothetical protein
MGSKPGLKPTTKLLSARGSCQHARLDAVGSALSPHGRSVNTGSIHIECNFAEVSSTRGDVRIGFDRIVHLEGFIHYGR